MKLPIKFIGVGEALDDLQHRSLVAKALNVSGFRRACPMAISRNACSLLDFPEFAQAVGYGVHGTRVSTELVLCLPFAFLARAPGIRWPTGQINSPIESPWEAHHGYR